jgi:hypothetical protein
MALTHNFSAETSLNTRIWPYSKIMTHNFQRRKNVESLLREEFLLELIIQKSEPLYLFCSFGSLLPLDFIKCSLKGSFDFACLERGKIVVCWCDILSKISQKIRLEKNRVGDSPITIPVGQR